MRIKQIQTAIIAGLLLLTMILPQPALAAGPEILNVVVLDTTSTTAAIYWTTNTSSDSRVNYGTTTALGQTEYDSTKTTTHFITLTELTPGTKYYFEVTSTDASGTATDDNAGAYYSFTTEAVAEYSITLEPACGVCGDLIDVQTCNQVIGVTALVAAAGTYHICWDARAPASVVGTFTTTGPGVRTLTFFMPEAKKGIHDVYLTNIAYDEKAKATFEVFPSAKISPGEGPVGTEVTLNGYGYGSQQTIEVEFNGTKISPATLKSDDRGSWTMSYIIPDTPGGGYTFDTFAQEGTERVNWVSKYFKVVPQITATPTSGTVKQTIQVAGTGFASNEGDIKITFDDEVRREKIFADADGSWTSSITVPLLTCGRYIITASGKTTRARDVLDVTFTVVPGIEVEPASAYVGDTITVTGGGFTPGETGIKVSFDGTVVPTATITPDIYGCWESSFNLPASTYGSHTVSASGATTASVTTTLTTKARLESISPDEGAPGDSVTLIGSGFHGNQILTVTVGGRNAELGDARTHTNGNVIISFRVPASTPGKQTVVVRDEGGATDSMDFTVKTKVLPSPLPISPEDSRSRSGQITFRWQGLPGETGITYTYMLEIKDADTGNVVRSKSVGEELSYTLTRDEALPRGTYSWQVKAVDNYENESPWSNPSPFTASPTPPWVWVIVGLSVLTALMVVAYRETKFKVTE